MNDYERDPGPGNRGGYGYDGVGLRMRTYEMLVAGMFHGSHEDDMDGDTDEGADEGIAEDGSRMVGVPDPDDAHRRERFSVLIPQEGGLPELLEVMLLRRVEERRDRLEPFEDHVLPFDHGTHEAGMPMGLPHIPDEELAVLRAWIEQGCPGPTEVTGMGGIDDGLLVPDGPIAVNRGCEVRLPSADRPAWSTQDAPQWHRPSPNAHRVPGAGPNPAPHAPASSATAMASPMTEMASTPMTAPAGME